MMKKLISLMLAALLATAAFCLPAYAYADHVNDGDTLEFHGATQNNAFGDLLDWTGVVFNDVKTAIFDMKGSLAVGGDVNTTAGFTISSGAYDAEPALTDDVAFLVNGNIVISGYGSVWGQTVAGKADGNTYHLSNFLTNDTPNGHYTVADSTQFFIDAKNTAAAVKTAVDALPANGVCEVANDVYTFVGDPNADILVYNVGDSMFNSYRCDFNIAEGQTIIVNLTSSDKIDMKYGGTMINGSMDPDYLRSFNRNIIVNVVNAAEMEMFHCDLYGTLLAPNTNLKGQYGDIFGTSILNSLNASNGFELHTGYNSDFVPAITASPSAVGDDPVDTPAETVGIRIDAPQKMAVVFEDGTVYYGGEMKDVEIGKEYLFRMCSVNWENGIYDGEENGLAGTTVYRMTVVHRNEFFEYARVAAQNPERYTVKGIDVIDNEAKTIIVNCDAADAHLETDVNNFFVAYRFHFENGDYNKKTGIEKVVNTPLESLSVNLPAGSTITCNAYVGDDKIDSDDVFITVNSGEGIYDNVLLTSVNDYRWAH